MSFRRWFFTPQGVWRLPWRLLWTSLAWLSLSLLLSAVAMLLLLFSGHEPLVRTEAPGPSADTSTITLSMSTSALMASLVVSALATAVTLALAARFWEPFTWADWGLHLHRGTAWRDLALGFGAAGLMQASVAAALYLSGAATWHLTPATDWTAWIRAAALWLFLFALVGWYEEALLRGYLFTTLAYSLRPWLAAVLSALVFAGLHAGNPGFSPLAFGGLTIIGLFFVALRRPTPWGLALPIGVHWGWNFFEGLIFGFPVSGLPVPTIAQATLTGPDWWTGGSFGPEAGAVVLVALIVGWILLRPSPSFLYPTRTKNDR